MTLDGTALAVHRHARKVAHVLVGAGELIEQGGLAAVLVAGQRKGQCLVFRQGVLPFFDVIPTALAKAWMLHHFILDRCVHRRDGLGGGDADLRGILQPQGQLVAVDAQLHGVPHGGQLDQGDLCARDQAHIQKMLPQCARTAHSVYYGAFADL